LRNIFTAQFAVYAFAFILHSRNSDRVVVTLSLKASALKTSKESDIKFEVREGDCEN